MKIILAFFFNTSNIRKRKRTMKICNTCLKTKDEKEFWYNPKTRDKLTTSCIICCKEYNDAYYKRNREKRIKQIKEQQKWSKSVKTEPRYK
jgi:hypothetical protein